MLFKMKAPYRSRGRPDYRNGRCAHNEHAIKRATYRRSRSSASARLLGATRFGGTVVAEHDVIGHRVVIGHQPANEFARIDSQRIGPGQISIRRNAAAAMLEL